MIRHLQRCLLAATSAITIAAPAWTQNAVLPVAPQRITIGFVDVEGDPRHETLKAYGRLVLKTREHPFAGAQVAIEEAQAIARVLKIDFALERITVKSAEAVAPAVLIKQPLINREQPGEV